MSKHPIIRSEDKQLNKYVFIFLSFYLSIAVLAFIFIRFMQNYGLDNRPQAASTAQLMAQSSVVFDLSKSYGQVDQSIGVVVPNSLDSALVQDLINNFSSKGVYIKLVDPSASVIESSGFVSLNSNGFKWYFSFSSEGQANSFLAFYFARFGGSPVVELRSSNSSGIVNVKNTYPQAKVHAASFLFCPRESLRDLVASVQPPTLEAVSIYTDQSSLGDIFPPVKLMFDTFFDCAADIEGTSVKIHYPPNTVLSVSDIKLSSISQDKKTGYITGLVLSAIFNEVQFKGKDYHAPIKYVIAGDFASKGSGEKMILSKLAEFIAGHGEIIWPRAVSGNGAPWDTGKNPSYPVVGLIGKMAGKYHIFLVNTAEENTNVNFSENIGLDSFSYYSSIRGQGNFSSSSSSISMQANETIYAVSSGSINPQPTILPTNPPLPTAIPTGIGHPTSPAYPTSPPQYPTSSPNIPESPDPTQSQNKITPPFTTRGPYGTSAPLPTLAAVSPTSSPARPGILKQTVSKMTIVVKQVFSIISDFTRKVLP